MIDGRSGIIILAIVPVLTACAPPWASPDQSSPGTPIPCATSSPVPIDERRPAVAGGFNAHGVHVRLEHNFPSEVVSFGLPLPPGAVDDARTLRVSAGGKVVPANVTVTLHGHDRTGNPAGVRAVLLEIPVASLGDAGVDLDVAWTGGASTVVAATPFAKASAPSPAVVDTAERTVRSEGGKATIVETSRCQRVLFTGREPAALALFPDGYLAATGILGPLVPAARVAAPDLAGLAFIPEEGQAFGLSAMYREAYRLNPDPESIPDPAQNYEGWLYDRCATFLELYAVGGDSRLLRHGYRSCSYYQARINLSGQGRGIFSGKPDPDPKYSHLRGLLAYYALTGDEGARVAGQAIADLWLNDQDFVAPYRAGHIRGPDKLWTERLLGTSLEGLLFGSQMLDDPKYLKGFEEILATAYRHITGDAATLAVINPGVGPFPPQNCFIHSAAQHSEGDDKDPWCSSWMSELTVAPLLAYQEQTGDPRVDEIFIRLTRFLRDVGTSYFKGDPVDDRFLKPSVRYNPDDGADRRVLIPLYGAGLGSDGKRKNSGESDDNQHCLDASALSAAGLRALKRQGGFDKNPIGPFRSEGESFLGLHQELAFCAQLTFEDQTRPKRDPSRARPGDLASGLSNPAGFIKDNKFGFPSHADSPERRLSWWLNTSLLQFQLLAEAGVAIPGLQPGRVQP